MTGERSTNPRDVDRVFEGLYEELHRIAARQFASERSGHTLQPTAIVSEAYLKLSRQAEFPALERTEMLGIASHAMRQVLIDHARKRATRKRGGDVRRTTLGDVGGEIDLDGLLALDKALDRLERIDSRLRRVVECRFFGGLSADETAEALGVTRRTVQRDWAKARAWLHATLDPDGGTS